MKLPIALTMLASPFSLPHDERWILPIALGFFTLLTVYFTWRLKTDEGDKWLFRPITGILFLYLMSQALVYGIYCVIQKKKTTAAM